MILFFFVQNQCVSRNKSCRSCKKNKNTAICQIDNRVFSNPVKEDILTVPVPAVLLGLQRHSGT